jgi:hypothetical protein
MKLHGLLAFALLLASTVCAAKGPVGIGKLEIGMSRSAVEALQGADGVHLVSPLTPYEYKYSSPVAGEDKFDTTVATPLSDEPLKAVLTFSAEKLQSIYIDLGDSSRIVDTAKDLISSKYGEPKTDNSMKEEQCVYKNGSNFKVSSGSIRYSWTQERPKAEPVKATVSDTVIDICPSNLRYAIGATKLKSLNIAVAKPEKPVTNPF